MALVKCVECGTEVSEYAEKCPTCGCPMSVINEHNSKPNNSNPYLVVSLSGDSIDLTGLENKITEEELKNEEKLYNILEKEYGADYFVKRMVKGMFEFNNYKFPQNYQELYDTQCGLNAQHYNNSPTIKCPTCGSTCVRRISTGAKWASAVLGSWYDKTARSQFECEHCGYMW